MLSLVILSCFLCFQVSAKESGTEGNQHAYEKGKDMATKMLAAIPDLTKVPVNDLSIKDKKVDDQVGDKKCASSLKSIPESDSTLQNTQHPDNQILVFVSFSMPLVALKNLAQEAEKHNARLIIRGLIENSFKKTAETLKDFESGLEINPELFKEYKIDKAPAFILVEKGKEKNRVYGNISLSYAAEKLKEPA